MIETLELIADILIVIMAAWVSRVFWAAYKQSGRTSILILSAIFLVVAVFKFLHVLLEDGFGLTQFAWMDSILAMEVLWLITAAGIVISLSGGIRWKRRLKSQEEASAGGRKAA